MTRHDGGTAQAWAALGGTGELVGRVAYRGTSGLANGPLPVRELARASVGACALAAAELAAVRAGRGADDVAPLVVDEGAVATAFVSERHLRVDGRVPVVFAPLSGFWRAADGWVRTHANYPHHEAALIRVLAAGTPEGVAEAVSRRSAVDVQEAVYARGGLAVAVAEPYGDPQPLVETRESGGRGRPLGPGAGVGTGAGARPMAGVRVLDLTRVIAGPVATRTLGLLGADVLRVDSPGLEESGDSYADTGFGKRSALLDLRDAADRAVFEGLLDEADVVVTGYRPGALERYGLGADDLLAKRPGLVVAQLCAWGWRGPWSDRRGFDSLVQAGYGISAAYGDGRGPGVLPAQALDHATGYLMAAGVLRALAQGGGKALRFSLAGTASWLVRDVPRVDGAVGADGAGSAYAPEPWLRETGSGYGTLRYAAWPRGGGGWGPGPTPGGSDRPRWL
ncbi:CoA transferase [Streptomyces sp. NPDC054961]